jgi:hypothetical protein
MTVLVDTSVWIRCLAGRVPDMTEPDRRLGRDEVAGHELVYRELLIGDRGGRRKLLGAYERMNQASVVPHREIIAFVRNRELVVEASAGSTFIFWRPPLWGGCSCGAPTASRRCCQPAWSRLRVAGLEARGIVRRSPQCAEPLGSVFSTRDAALTGQANTQAEVATAIRPWRSA